MKNYNEFINESIFIHTGDFIVTKKMVLNGKLIKELIPREVIGDFDCVGLELTSLEGSPREVTGDFDCSELELSSLEGCPESVSGSFYCYGNQLTSLEGGPKSVGGSFYCYGNQLTSLEGGPEEVGGSFNCYYNKLTTLEGCPKNFSNTIYVDKDLEIEKDFIEAGKYINEYWMDLLKHMIDKGIDLTEVKGWPKVFIDTLELKYRNLLISAKTISKFKL